jgi:cell division protein FtsL
MWVNVCLSKHSHSQVTTFKHHLKQNNDFAKLIYEEDHLPKHMRLDFVSRLIRYLFVPICFVATVCLMH